MSQIILASASPRRKALLEQIGMEFEICPAKGEEVITESRPDAVVSELSRQKAEEVAAGVLTYNEQHPDLATPQDILVIGADTVVAYGDEILGKPKDEEDAKRMLTLLQGNTHSVYTGITLVFIDKSGRTGEYCFSKKPMLRCIQWMRTRSTAILQLENQWTKPEVMAFRDDVQSTLNK